MDWGDIPFFLELCRHRTLSAAARALRVSHVTVARRLISLEANLGLVLFNRVSDGYELTPDGLLVEEHARAMQEAADLILEHGRSASPNAPRLVRITATRALSDAWLVEQLESLRRGRPGLMLEILTTSRNLSLARNEADIALRLARPPDGELLIRKMATLGYGFYVARDMMAAGTPERRAFILYEQGSGVPEAIWLERETAGRPVALRSNSLLAQKTAARSGLGVALLPCYLADQDEKLCRIELSLRPPEREVWMVTTQRAARQPHVRAVMDDLAGAFARDRALFTGSVTGEVQPPST